MLANAGYEVNYNLGPSLPHQSHIAFKLQHLVAIFTANKPDVVEVGAYIAGTAIVGAIPACIRVAGAEYALTKSVEYGELYDAHIALILDPENVVPAIVVG